MPNHTVYVSPADAALYEQPGASPYASSLVSEVTELQHAFTSLCSLCAIHSPQEPFLAALERAVLRGYPAARAVPELTHELIEDQLMGELSANAKLQARFAVSKNCVKRVRGAVQRFHHAFGLVLAQAGCTCSGTRSIPPGSNGAGTRALESRPFQLTVQGRRDG